MVVSPGGWLRAVGAAGLAAVLLASSCAFHPGGSWPEGVPPPTGAAVPAVDIHADGRPADALRGWAEQRASAMAMPAGALEAYAYAAAVAREVNPDCRIDWTTLAGIGFVESRHGTHRGASIAPDGEVSPAIRGARLDGTGGTMRILDSDGGNADGDDGHDRAMGPMQFIPATWRLYGVDANNDGRVSPDNIDDAALSAAGYLCWVGKDLSTPRGWTTALRAYNNSDAYARAVRDAATDYAAGRSH